MEVISPCTTAQKGDWKQSWFCLDEAIKPTLAFVDVISSQENRVYRFLQPILFRLDPELAHRVALIGLEVANRLGMRRAPERKKMTVMGLQFPNPVGLAAGFDKNGRHIDELMSCGFGFIEIGTVTPRPQPGNPRPRLYRIREAEALINRMGFNNDGVDKAITNLEHTNYKGVVGVSIGKNAGTPLDKAADDYLHCLRRAYNSASYVVLNISSPGTVGLRRLQEPEYLIHLLSELKAERNKLADEQNKYVPLVVKVAPDFERSDLRKISEILLAQKIDGIIATNTTLSRSGVEELRYANEEGGLSGAPLRDKALHVLMELNQQVEGAIPLIASGGIMNADDAMERIDAGASLIQVYTGFVYRGPRLINEIARRIP
jgi:dihydroorotate dehydrogenase